MIAFVKNDFEHQEEIIFIFTKRFTMTLKEKLERLKHINDDKTESDWEIYKRNWTSSISRLQHTITDKWLEEFSVKGLMEFTLIPVSRLDPYIDIYLTTVLEITLVNNKSLVLEPISGITSEFFR